MAQHGDPARSEPLRQQVNHFLLVWKPTFGQLRVDQRPVHFDFKTPTAGRDEFETRDPLFELFENAARQTDGLWFVVSLRAIL